METKSGKIAQVLSQLGEKHPSAGAMLETLGITADDLSYAVKQVHSNSPHTAQFAINCVMMGIGLGYLAAQQLLFGRKQ